MKLDGDLFTFVQKYDFTKSAFCYYIKRNIGVRDGGGGELLPSEN
jgi:hypothetical protein